MSGSGLSSRSFSIDYEDEDAHSDDHEELLLRAVTSEHLQNSSSQSLSTLKLRPTNLRTTTYQC